MLTSPRIENDNDNNRETVELNELSNQNNDPPQCTTNSAPQTP